MDLHCPLSLEAMKLQSKGQGDKRQKSNDKYITHVTLNKQRLSMSLNDQTIFYLGALALTIDAFNLNWVQFRFDAMCLV